MPGKPKLKGLALYAAGFLTAVALMLGIFANQGALAVEYSCARTDLNAAGYSGDLSSATYNIYYDIPSCVAASGYKATQVWLRNDNQIGVKYLKP
jgi:hypothetical protein